MARRLHKGNPGQIPPLETTGYNASYPQLGAPPAAAAPPAPTPVPSIAAPATLAIASPPGGGNASGRQVSRGNMGGGPPMMIMGADGFPGRPRNVMGRPPGDIG